MQQSEKEFSFYDLFVPLTTKKAVIFIVLIGLFVFFNALFNGFVWDDNPYIILNPEVHQVHITSLIGTNSFNKEGQYRPIPAIYFAVLYSLFTTTPFFYHLLGLGLHITNAILVFFVLKHFFHKKISFILSLLFLVHPMQVESASYIASSDNTLFFLFGITAFLLSLKEKISWKRFVSIASLLLLSILTKETGILFFGVILLYRVLFQRKQLGSFVISSLVAIILYVAMRVGIGKVYLAQAHPILLSMATFPLSIRLLNLPAIIFYYIKTFFYPAAFAIDQQWVYTIINFQSFYFPLFMVLLFFLLVASLGVYIYRTNKTYSTTYLFFLLWFLAGLGLHMQIFPLDMTVSDRWFYFPIVGLIGLIGTSIASIRFKQKNLERAGIFAIAVVLGLFSLRTIIRNTNWVDDLTLFTHDAQIQDNYEIENNIGAIYTFQKQYNLAIPHLLKSITYVPSDTNLYNLASAYAYIGNYTKADDYYKEAVLTKNISLGHAQKTFYAERELARIAILQNDPHNALHFIQEAMKYSPTDGTLWLYYAIGKYQLGQQEEALTAAEKAKAVLANQESEIIYSRILHKQPLIFQ